ncbi:MAG: hypothetical protein Q7J54_06425 [Candidatus Woesearchaeota archaeon]|nr:hypothetical protein [Candidatus Woesearchaeota archaeon]
MALYISFVSGVCFLSGAILIFKGAHNIKSSGRNVHLVFIGLALLAGTNNFWFLAEKELNELTVFDNAVKTQISQVKTADKPHINGYPISCDDLPNGTYSRMKESERFAFVYREIENPFEQNIIAVYSDGRIPWRFVIVKIPEEIQEEIEKIEKKQIKIKNPFVVVNP